MAWDKRKGITEFIVLSVLLLSAFLFLFTCWGVTDSASEMVSILIVISGSVLVLAGFGHRVSGMQCAILYTGYLVRCICMLVDIYGRSYITLLHSGGDSETFSGHASALYEGNMSGSVSTKYPYVINWIYHVAGENRLCAQYINVVLWVLSAWVLVRICSRFKVAENNRNIIYAIWALLPTGILLSGILMRESAEMFFGMWSFERFLYWMQEGRRKYCIQAFLCVVPAVILHSASVALWVTYVLVIMFWNVREQRYMWQVKSCFVFPVCLVGMMLARGTPLWTILFAKLGGDFSLYGITHRGFYSAGSDYLANMDCQSWLQFVPYTLVRMFYFLFSPLPVDARGIKDIAIFLADGLPLAVVICQSLAWVRRKKEIRGYAGAALLGGLSFAGIFAWGVRNAGTALRHRYLAWSIFLAALCICCGYSSEEETEAEKNVI